MDDGDPIEFETAWPPSYVAASQHWGVKKLQKQLEVPGVSKDPIVKGDTLLCVAARFGNVEGVRLLIDSGYDVNECTQILAEGMRSESALETAALWGHLECVKLLLSKGATAHKAEALAFAKEANHNEACGGGSKEDYLAIANMLK